MMNQKAFSVKLLTLLGFVLASFCFSGAANADFSEKWKGRTEVPPLEFGMLGGAAFLGKDVNWSVLMTGAYQIQSEGWADDLDDRVWVEVEAGPSFMSTPVGNQSGFQYSVHLRWDFTYDERWNFYALGGLGGFGLPRGLGSSFILRPRLGAGVQFQTKAALIFRGEVSSEFLGAGFGFNF